MTIKNMFSFLFLILSTDTVSLESSLSYENIPASILPFSSLSTIVPPNTGVYILYLQGDNIYILFSINHKYGWAPKNWRFWTVVLKKTLESPLDCKEIKPVNPKGNQSWIFIGRTDAEAEAPILWPPDAKSWLFRKDPDAGKDWRREEKQTTEDRTLVWHHRFNGLSLSKLQEVEKDREAWCASVQGLKRVRHDWETEQEQCPHFTLQGVILEHNEISCSVHLIMPIKLSFTV